MGGFEWGVNDSMYIEAKNTFDADVTLCFRCKLLTCAGIKQCVFDSNVFPAKK